VVGRFFFVYQAQAIRDDIRLRTYEFLHATFGEYLIAHLVTHELSDLADAAQFAASRGRPAPTGDAFLHALLSFMPLALRGTVVSFLAEQLQALPEHQRHHVRPVLAGLFRGCLSPGTTAATPTTAPSQTCPFLPGSRPIQRTWSCSPCWPAAR